VANDDRKHLENSKIGLDNSWNFFIQKSGNPELAFGCLFETSSPCAVTLSWHLGETSGEFLEVYPGDMYAGNCAGLGLSRENIQVGNSLGGKWLGPLSRKRNVLICMPDYKSVRVMIMMCATLVNTQRDSFWLAVPLASPTVWAKNIVFGFLIGVQPDGRYCTCTPECGGRVKVGAI